uniref:Uncharacterized protein n=1 Tax=Glossina austeni TaxID=7395 RepID=A0A1A9VAQ4_GLOAU
MFKKSQFNIQNRDLKIKSKFYVKLQEFVQLFNGLLCPNLIASSLSSKRMLLSTRLFSSVASVTKASSTLRFSLAEVSITNSTSVYVVVHVNAPEFLLWIFRSLFTGQNIPIREAHH